MTLPTNFLRYLPLVQLLILFGCDPSAEDDCGHNALYYALKRGNPKIVEEIFDALSKPLSLMRICRWVATSKAGPVFRRTIKVRPLPAAALRRNFLTLLIFHSNPK